MAGVCTSCGSAVADSARFCSECGSAQAPRSCPSCGAAAEGRFCSQCGAALGADAAASDRATPVAERRVTSVLFADLVGFTSVSEARDAEDVRELLSRYFDEARLVVARYGGAVEKFIGDAVMAVWGAPSTHEDDAERAVRAGLELVGAVHALAAEVGVPGLDMRVGVVTGEVAVTLGASGQGMVAGDAVNTASRVQSAARPGQVWVDEGTRARTMTSITYEDVGEHPLKGKAAPARLYVAHDVVASIGGADRVDGLEAPMVGRVRELRLVKELFHSSEERSRPGALLLEGQAGVGKSRLAWEFEKYVDGLSGSVLWHRGRCLSYGEGVAFWALSEIVRVRLGLVEESPAPDVPRKLAEALEPIVPDRAERDWLLPRLGVLVGAGTAAEFSRAELFSAWTMFFERVGAGSPVVLVIDDGQHADDALLDFLEHLLAQGRFPVFALVLARTGIVERRPGLATARGATVLRLEPLGDEEMSELLDGLVAGLPPDARGQLVRRSEGVPLFAVETVRALIDKDLVVPQAGRYVVAADVDALDVDAIGAPASLFAVVAARLDALPVAERRTVGDASVLGLSFREDGIRALAAEGVDIDEVLASLVRKQILSVQNDRFSAEFGQYRFVQGVVRQVAYETLSRRDRKVRHLAVAAHIAAQADPTDDSAGVVAQHYLDAVDAAADTDDDVPELVRSATQLLERAAVRAKSLGAHQEANRYLEGALERIDEPADRARLLVAAADARYNVGRIAESVALAAEAADAYREVGDELGAAHALGVQGLGLLAEGYNADIVQLLQPVWDMLEHRPEAVPTALMTVRVLAAAYLGLGDLEAASQLQVRRIVMAEATGDAEQLADALIGLGVLFWSQHAPVVGRTLLEAAGRLARDNGLIGSLTFALCNLAAQTLPRDPAAALAYADEASAVAGRAGVVAWLASAWSNRSLALWTTGRWDELADQLDLNRTLPLPATDAALCRALELHLVEASGRTATLELEDAALDEESYLAWFAHGELLAARSAGDLAAACARGQEAVSHGYAAGGFGDDFLHHWVAATTTAFDAGDVELAAGLVAMVQQAPSSLVEKGLRANVHRFHGLLLAARGEDPAVIEESMRTGIDLLTEYGSLPLLAAARAELGRWLTSVGRAEEGAELVGQALQAYREIGATALVGALGRVHPG